MQKDLVTRTEAATQKVNADKRQLQLLESQLAAAKARVTNVSPSPDTMLPAELDKKSPGAETFKLWLQGTHPDMAEEQKCLDWKGVVSQKLANEFSKWEQCVAIVYAYIVAAKTRTHSEMCGTTTEKYAEEAWQALRGQPRHFLPTSLHPIEAICSEGLEPFTDAGRRRLCMDCEPSLGPIGRRPTHRNVAGPYLILEGDKIQNLDISACEDATLPESDTPFKQYMQGKALPKDLPDIFAANAEVSTAERRAMSDYLHAVGVVHTQGQLDKLVPIGQYFEEFRQWQSKRPADTDIEVERTTDAVLP